MADERTYRARPRATCPHCGEQVVIRLDGLCPIHGPHPFWQGQWNCPGSEHLPVEGVLMDCIFCSSLFISEDDEHRFCSEECVNRWESDDGSWEGWDVTGWKAERFERESCNPTYEAGS